VDGSGEGGNRASLNALPERPAIRIKEKQWTYIMCGAI